MKVSKRPKSNSRKNRRKKKLRERRLNSKLFPQRKGKKSKPRGMPKLSKPRATRSTRQENSRRLSLSIKKPLTNVLGSPLSTQIKLLVGSK
jgi:hypothetical protein